MKIATPALLAVIAGLLGCIVVQLHGMRPVRFGDLKDSQAFDRMPVVSAQGVDFPSRMKVEVENPVEIASGRVIDGKWIEAPPVRVKVDP